MIIRGEVRQSLWGVVWADVEGVPGSLIDMPHLPTDLFISVAENNALVDYRVENWVYVDTVFVGHVPFLSYALDQTANKDPQNFSQLFQ